MTLQKVALTPGVNKMASPTANEGGWSDGNRVRFRMGMPEKLRGWVKYLTTAFLGVPRGMLLLYELAGDALLALGTHNHLYMTRGGAAIDITPVDRTITTASIVTTAGDTTAAITSTATHGLTPGDFLTFDTISGVARTPSGLTIGGVALAGDYAVVSASTNTTFTIALGAATTAQTDSTARTITCFMPAGPADAVPGLGWGAGGYGLGAYGLASGVAANTLPVRLWSLDAWGETLLAAPSQGRLLSWSPDASGNVSARASYVANTTTAANGPPLRIGGMTVGMPERHAILFGCSDLNSLLNFDPLLVRFSDVEDYSTWNATATNSAGSFRLQGGGEIKGWLNSTLQTLIWTDIAMWTMRFIGAPLFYSFSKADGNCGLIAQNARADLSGTTYWMGPQGFWAFLGGAPAQLQCTLQDEVFDNLNRAQQSKVTCGTNSINGEVIWFYPSTDGIEIDSYVILNTRESVWYGGRLSRTVWIDRGVVGHPMATDADGFLYNHEVGTEADGEPMGEFIESGFFDIEDGESLLFVDRFIPDWQNFAGTATLTIRVCDYPNAPPRTLGPYTITPTTKHIPFRARGRQASIRIDGGGIGANWRLGAARFNVNPDGTR